MAVDEFGLFVDRTGIPFVSSYMGRDILPEHPLRRGVIGTHGDSGGMDALVLADRVLVLGCRLSQNTTGYDREFFKGKKLTVVDVDLTEHMKPGVDIHEFFCEDVKAWICTHLPKG